MRLAQRYLRDILIALMTPRMTAEAVPLTPRALCGTGFSREAVGRNTAKFRVPMLTNSRLKPVPLAQRPTT